MTPFDEDHPLSCEFPECDRALVHPGDGEVFYLFGLKPVAACTLHAPVVERIGTAGMRLLRLGGRALLKRMMPDLERQVQEAEQGASERSEREEGRL